jgi:hypothetical protein
MAYTKEEINILNKYKIRLVVDLEGRWRMSVGCAKQMKFETWEEVVYHMTKYQEDPKAYIDYQGFMLGNRNLKPVQENG